MSIWRCSSYCACGNAVSMTRWTSFSNFSKLTGPNLTCMPMSHEISWKMQWRDEGIRTISPTKIIHNLFPCYGKYGYVRLVILILWEIILSDQERKWNCWSHNISIAGKRYWKTSSAMAYNIGTLLYILSLIFIKETDNLQKRENTSQFLFSYYIMSQANVTLVIRYYSGYWADRSFAI